MSDVGIFVHSVFPSFRHCNFYSCLDAFCNSRVVHVDYLLALVAVIVYYGFLEVLDCVSHRNDVGKLKEGGLHDHVDSAAKAQLLGYFYRINRIELNVAAGNEAFHETRQFFIKFCSTPGAVQ